MNGCRQGFMPTTRLAEGKRRHSPGVTEVPRDTDRTDTRLVIR